MTLVYERHTGRAAITPPPPRISPFYDRMKDVFEIKSPRFIAVKEYTVILIPSTSFRAPLIREFRLHSNKWNDVRVAMRAKFLASLCRTRVFMENWRLQKHAVYKNIRKQNRWKNKFVSFKIVISFVMLACTLHFGNNKTKIQFYSIECLFKSNSDVNICRTNVSCLFSME